MLQTGSPAHGCAGGGASDRAEPGKHRPAPRSPVPRHCRPLTHRAGPSPAPRHSGTDGMEPASTMADLIRSSTDGNGARPR